MGKYRRYREGTTLAERLREFRKKPLKTARNIVLPIETISYAFGRSRARIAYSGFTPVFDEYANRLGKDVLRVAGIAAAVYGLYQLTN